MRNKCGVVLWTGLWKPVEKPINLFTAFTHTQQNRTEGCLETTTNPQFVQKFYSEKNTHVDSFDRSNMGVIHIIHKAYINKNYLNKSISLYIKQLTGGVKSSKLTGGQLG